MFPGITLYYLMENIALTYTYASNVGIISKEEINDIIQQAIDL